MPFPSVSHRIDSEDRLYLKSFRAICVTAFQAVGHDQIREPSASTNWTYLEIAFVPHVVDLVRHIESVDADRPAAAQTAAMLEAGLSWHMMQKRKAFVRTRRAGGTEGLSSSEERSVQLERVKNLTVANKRTPNC